MEFLTEAQLHAQRQTLFDAAGAAANRSVQCFSARDYRHTLMPLVIRFQREKDMFKARNVEETLAINKWTAAQKITAEIYRRRSEIK